MNDDEKKPFGSNDDNLQLDPDEYIMLKSGQDIVRLIKVRSSSTHLQCCIHLRVTLPADSDPKISNGALSQIRR